MNIFSVRYNWSMVLLLISITSYVSPILAVYYHGYVGLLILLLPCLGMLNFSFRNSFYTIGLRTMRLNKVMLISLIWYIIGIAFLFLRGSNDTSFFIQAILLPVFLFIGMVLTKNKKYKSLAVFLVMIFTVINCLMVGGVGQNINARSLNDSDDLYNEAGSTAFWGLIGIMMPIFFVEIIMLKSKLSKVFMAILFVYLIYQLLNCGYATPIALFIINLFVVGIVYLIKAKIFSKRFWRTIIIFSLSVFLGYYIMQFILQSTITSQIDVKDRFTNFIVNPVGGGYNSKEGVSRFTLMNFSWQSFLKNPLFGGGGNIRTSMYQGISGGHSSAIDVLAVLGLFGGGGAFIFFVLKAFHNAYKKLKNKNNFYNICNLSVMLTFFIGGIMNPYWAGGILIFILLLSDIYVYK